MTDRGMQVVKLVYNEKEGKLEEVWDPPLETESLEWLAGCKFMLFDNVEGYYIYYWLTPTGLVGVEESQYFLPDWLSKSFQVPDGTSFMLPSSVLRMAYKRYYGEVYLYS
ncbi:MAG: hypothetical protein QXP04_05165 [Candidatus Nanoarchaeia archaeon]|nr:hypothetical protein [Candidatus Jingweiarchaeum tengchongense]